MNEFEELIPTDEELTKEIRAISTTAPHLMVCANCRNYGRLTHECCVHHKTFMPFVRGCNGKDFVTDEEHLLMKVKKDLLAQVMELEKVENTLALMLATSCAATCFAEDLEKRIKTIRKLQTDVGKRSDLRKDLDLAEDVEGALNRINQAATKMQKDLQLGLDKIEQQYRLHIERHLNNLFTTGGKFDVHKSDSNLNNAMTFCEVLGKFVKACINNKKNYEMFFAFLDNLKNDAPYGLDNSDFKRYNFRM